MRTNQSRMQRAVALAGMVILAGLAPVVSMAAPGSGQVPVTVEIVKPIDIGAITINEEKTIDYDANEAAVFLISGMKNRTVTLIIGSDDLEAQTGTTSDVQSNTLPLLLSGLNCAYSLDGGQTWVPFETDELSISIKLPNDQSANQITQILLRVGGTVHSAPNQQRGAYQGRIAVSAAYSTSSDGRRPAAVLTGAAPEAQNEFDDPSDVNEGIDY